MAKRQPVGTLVKEPAELAAKPCARLVVLDNKEDGKRQEWHTLGQCFPKKRLFLRSACGEATGNGQTFKLATLMTGEPLVQCVKTGKFYLMSWQDIINLAQRCGIEEEDKCEKPLSGSATASSPLSPAK